MAKALDEHDPRLLRKCPACGSTNYTRQIIKIHRTDRSDGSIFQSLEPFTTYPDAYFNCWDCDYFINSWGFINEDEGERDEGIGRKFMQDFTDDNRNGR